MVIDFFSSSSFLLEWLEHEELLEDLCLTGLPDLPRQEHLIHHRVHLKTQFRGQPNTVMKLRILRWFKTEYKYHKVVIQPAICHHCVKITRVTKKLTWQDESLFFPSPAFLRCVVVCERGCSCQQLIYLICWFLAMSYMSGVRVKHVGGCSHAF